MKINVLATRNTNCSELTATEFVKMMMEDMITAQKTYDDIWYPIELDNYNKRIENNRKYVLETVTKYAEKHWKTEKKRNEYIESEMDRLVNKSKFDYHTISFFDFDVCPWDNGISGDCILSYDNMTIDAMIHCFDKIKDNKYFKVAKGWVLEDHYGFRPQIKLILDDNVQAEFDKDENNLSDSIRRFYDGTNYWGD